MKEYAIWGKAAPHNLNETLLLTTFEGNKIESEETAKELASILEVKHGCTETRIQCIDWSDKDDLFVKSVKP